MKKLMAIVPLKGKTPEQIGDELQKILMDKGMMDAEGNFLNPEEKFTEYEDREDTLLWAMKSGLESGNKEGK